MQLFWINNYLFLRAINASTFTLLNWFLSTNNEKSIDVVIDNTRNSIGNVSVNSLSQQRQTSKIHTVFTGETQQD